jgi:hypothetical protein
MKEIVRLSQEYGIITEYTDFVAHSGFDGGALGGAVATATVFREADRRLTLARDFDSGQWAFNQARNDIALQSKLAVNEENNTFVDRSGRTVAYDSIKQVGAKAYYMRQGQWVDAQDNAKLKERVVELYSDDYFQLLRDNKDFARAQRLGWAISVNVGEERIVVEKDGKRVDDELLKRSQALPQVPLDQNGRQGGFRDLQNFQQERIQNFDRGRNNQLPIQNEFNRRIEENGPERQEEGQ